MAERAASGWRRLWPWLAAIGVLYAGFEIGRASAGYWAGGALANRIELGRRIGQLQSQSDAQERRLASAEIGRRVDLEAQSEAQRMIGELQAETARQQQELQFYRGLVARQFGTGNLRVQELRVQRADERRYRIQITLVQASARDSIASGALTLMVDGSKGGVLAQLPLADLEPAGRKELAFSLRYFQQVEAEIELPAGFVPASLQIEYRLGRGSAAPVRQTFSWQVEGEAQNPVL